MATSTAFAAALDYFIEPTKSHLLITACCILWFFSAAVVHTAIASYFIHLLFPKFTISEHWGIGIGIFFAFLPFIIYLIVSHGYDSWRQYRNDRFMERARQDPNNHEYFKEWDKANGVVAKTDPVEEKYDYSKFTKTLTE